MGFQVACAERPTKVPMETGSRKAAAASSPPGLASLSRPEMTTPPRRCSTSAITSSASASEKVRL